MKIPEKIPECGYYYHYKHDPTVSINNYAYEVIGVGLHTELGHNDHRNTNYRPDDGTLVVYRPIYESTVYKAGKFFDIRPLEMFMEDVTREGKTFPRFKKITDENTIGELEKIKKEMYGDV